MLNLAHQGYIYQDILGAYFVAHELAHGKGSTKFHFDFKKTPNKIPDKFDDLTIYHDESTIFIQIKYSNYEHPHSLSKQDFSSSSSHDLALFDLFETWKALHGPGCAWRILLAWNIPAPDDPINSVLIQLPDTECFLPGTICYQFNCDVLWPNNGEVLLSWRKLKAWAKSIDRNEFKAFLKSLVIEVNCPKSSLLRDLDTGIEKLLSRTIERIGIGIYPNDHLTVRQVAESLCTITLTRRATHDSTPIRCDEIAKNIKIIQTYGGIEQKFTVDNNVLVTTPDRVGQVVTALEQYCCVILTAEPGAGKSWFIENLENHFQKTTQVIKHYCYIALEDPFALKRITVNVLYGSLIRQILQKYPELGHSMTQRYASNLEQLNILLRKLENKTLLIIDGIDHIWRVYQKNRGGLTEDETKILQALTQLDHSNSNVSILVVSQPIDQLSELTHFHQCTLAKLPESFVEKLLEKHAVPNIVVDEITLAHVIHQKSNGNALYCKYLIDHAVTNKAHTSFEWLEILPPYEFNLTGYYQHLYDQIHSDTGVPFALCGADFSITETELKDITCLGNLVSKQLTLLKPILKYIPAVGYSIYHESFKRFIIDRIKAQGASIDHLIYSPLITWLETYSFFESPKAYGHLLKLYYEVDAYDTIAKTISIDFLDNSLYNAQPFNTIRQNHNLQKASLQYVDGFTPLIIIAEQSKVIYELDNFSNEVLIQYLKTVQKIHGDDAMYRILWDEDNLLIDIKDALRFLVIKAYEGEEIVHWSIIPKLTSIPYDLLGFIAIKHLHTMQYDRFDDMVKDIYEDPRHRKAFDYILGEAEWWCIYNGNDWIKYTPYYNNILNTFKPIVSTLEQAVELIISNDMFIHDDNWEVMLHDVVILTKTSSTEEIETVIQTLSNYNWFRNWLIYLIRITDLSRRDFSAEELFDAFTYLVRDLEPFKGNPRTSDLHKQLPYIKKSYHLGLMLCKEHEEILIKCSDLLEKVTDTTTSIQRSFSGPLTQEVFLELITSYLPRDYVINKYKEYYDLVTRRIYFDVAEINFKYAYVLSDSERDSEAKEKYREGIQALTAYGFRKDRTLSEILYCSVPYQTTYGTLSVEWFYELYYMARTVVTHTDGRSTSRYPIEWFEEFIKVYPDEALRFLVSETFESSEANWYQEDGFYSILKENASLFSPTQWFLLCKSLPLASSSEIIEHGLSVIDHIDNNLKDVFKRWLQSVPYVRESATYSPEIVTQFEYNFGIHLDVEEKNESTEDSNHTEIPSPITSFEVKSVYDALAFLESNELKEIHVTRFKEFFISITDLKDKKVVLRQVAKSFKYRRKVGKWVEELFEPESFEWLYFNVCLFVFIIDGWYHGLSHRHYFKCAYEVNPEEAISMLKEVLGYYLSGGGNEYLMSCNLITALSEIKVEEAIVKPLLDTTFQIIKNRLPHPPSSRINKSLFDGLAGLSRDEMVVALLISRLKTLTTEKTQGIIWSLTYIAQTAPETLLRPYSWVLLNSSLLLPIHRALLLQILIEYVDQSLIHDELIGQFLNSYPTGFFLEDQYIRSFVDYKIELDEKSAKNIQLAPHEYDEGFLPYTHFKYRVLVKHIGPLIGSFNSFTYKRDKINKAHEGYYIRSDEVMTSIVPLANAAYEIVNGQYYASLKEITSYLGASYICDLRFFLDEVIIQVGSLAKRPSCLPSPDRFPSFEVRNDSHPFKHEGWILLASKEKELYGERFKKKKTRFSSLVLTFGKEPKHGEELYAQYIFNSKLYRENIVDDAPFDKPICILTIQDTLEYSLIVYVSPFIIRELGLKIGSNHHEGFNAYNDKGELIIQLTKWKEDYFGSVSDGTEVPRLEGVGVMIREDYYEDLLTLYPEECRFVLSQDNAE